MSATARKCVDRWRRFFCSHQNSVRVGPNTWGRMGPQMQCQDCGRMWREFVEGD